MTFDDYANELADLDDAERLETLIELGGKLPPLSEERAAVPFPASCRVQECQTPVHLWVTLRAGRVHIEADVPRKSPTVRGLVALLVDAFNGQSPEVVMHTPDDVLTALHLGSALGMTRQQGARGVITRIKREIQGQLAQS